MKIPLFKHIPAFVTALVWGSTFVASKHILLAGVSPVVVMTVRFLIAYVALCAVIRDWRPIRFDRNELLFFLLGLSGGSLYFFLEYTALQRTSAINVGLISATVPIISTTLSIFLGKVRIWRNYVFGSILAFGGVVLVVLNGHFAFTVYPIGDIIAIASSILWAIYTIILDKLGTGFSEVFISRRLFFYALITILPFTFFTTSVDDFLPLFSVDVILPTLYLGVFASTICIWLWNVSINSIGLIVTNNYLYALPVVSVAASAIFMDGEITVYNCIGSLLILVGIILADRR